MKSYTRICARIDLDTIEENLEHLKGNLSEDTKLIVVVKADAYGHGALQTAGMLSLKEYVWGFAVATLDEAIVLRRGGITKPLLVLGCVFPEQWLDAVENNIRLTVYSADIAKKLSDLAVKRGRVCSCEIGYRNGTPWICSKQRRCRGDKVCCGYAGTDSGRNVYPFCQGG